MSKSPKACAFDRPFFWIKRVNLGNVAKGVKGMAIIVRGGFACLGSDVPMVKLACLSVFWRVPTVRRVVYRVFF
ncbi:hypothetical protein [Moraxella caprae]|uniref:hypothetical protein n=1 Tax=Moraxella caprae TaxID=90240 RepID=UPI0004214661|nr:hypothetical protein [Moraxella caprae]